MTVNFEQLAKDIKTWGKDLGFSQVGITDVDLSDAEEHLQEWLAKNFHGTMGYMEKHGTKRSRPAELIPGTIRIISVRLNYLPPDAQMQETLDSPDKAYVSRYATGKDYHKVIRKRLVKLAKQVQAQVPETEYRAFTDSAPVLERDIALKAGLGWRGKHTLVLNREEGSWFFLGEIYTNIPLPIDTPYDGEHCGRCTACIDICPTQAIVAPHQLDARRCISYLTIELKESIPVEFRPLIGNRIFGCDDCQMVCPWNRFAKPTDDKDFKPRHYLMDSELVDLFLWDEETFLENTLVSPIRRLGHERWLRNIAVALGNAATSPEIIAALKQRLDHPSALVREHVQWALAKHT
ncbi:MAG: epoxyqueuosine reductase [marine bacterium B5-7]|nr:MAG: epoxyqueuosine reductase [marine bacterium B5-7]